MERDRERERERERQKDRQTDRQTDRNRRTIRIEYGVGGCDKSWGQEIIKLRR